MPREDTQFKPGQSGNPAGRPVGARQKLTSDFINALAKDFAEFGVEAIALVREEKTDAYLATVAKLVPKAIEHSGPEGEPIEVKNIEYTITDPGEPAGDSQD